MSDGSVESGVDSEDQFYLDDDDLEDRLGRIDQQIIDGELVLTRLSIDEGRGSCEVLRFNFEEELIRIFPKSTQHGSLVPQFARIEELQIERPGWDWSDHSAEHGQYALLYARNLPKGFSAIYEYGLGIQRDYRGLVDGIENQTSCSTVRFVVSGVEGLDPFGEVYRLSLERLEKYRVAVDRSRSRGQTAVRRVIQAETHNAIADLFGLELTEPKYGRLRVIQNMTEEVATGHVVSSEDRALLADELTTAAPAIAREAPERLVRLRENLELVSLDLLIEQLEKDLIGSHAHDEDHWQAFFNNNRFALQMIFSTPIVIEREHAIVQAADIDGRGSRITDFLCANSVTRTVLIVEIKTPAAALMRSTPYRGKGTDAAVYAPHHDLTGSVAQLQSQMASVPRSLASRLTPDIALDPWNDARGGVIIGRISALNHEQLDSLLRYRAGLSTVTVLGYDEVLDRLRALRTMLASSPEAGGSK